MKKRFRIRLFAMILCALLLISGLPLTALAAEAEEPISMVAGDVIRGFADPEEFTVLSEDSDIAWVDENGDLNALKAGTATLVATAEDGTETEYTVNVADYSDGSPVVGNLKILVRYNDSMQFYDGHVYLLFTSYQDGVTVTVPDLYAGYEIDEQYYEDIREDISVGSNHTGNNAETYFTLNKDMKSVTLNRGEIVTIGMYRDFDLSVPQAALGSITGSSAWSGIVSAGKAGVIYNVFEFLTSGRFSDYDAVSEIKAIFDEVGVDYGTALNGVVDGGVCFNRELYNQKLEWDQYENVTYELDITENQLNTMQMYLGGNNGKFSIMKNSCATVALRAWNAAVGTKNGEPNAYYLSSAGEGVLSVIDTPKGVRDSIINRLPGCYLNNADDVGEPDAGYQDDTGWVYVSAPEKVAPVNYIYTDDTFTVDESKTKLTSLINIAKEGSGITYNKDEQQIDVEVGTAVQNDITTIASIEFTVNGQTVSLNGENAPEGGVWFKTAIGEPDNDERFYVADADGKALPTDFFYDGEQFFICFCADSLPVSFKVVGAESAKGVLVSEIKGEEAGFDTEIYVKDGENKRYLKAVDEVEAGEMIYVKSKARADEGEYVLSDIMLNGISFRSGDNYDSDEAAYCVEMPEIYSTLTVIYEKAKLEVEGDTILQVNVGDTLNIEDYASLYVGDQELYSDDIVWEIAANADGAVEVDGREAEAVKPGTALLYASCASNPYIKRIFRVSVYEDLAEMAMITVSKNTNFEDILIVSQNGDDAEIIPRSGYYVKKGSVLMIIPFNADSRAILTLSANGETVWYDEEVTVTGDTEIDARFAGAKIKNMPGKINLATEDDTYQFDASVEYTGLLQFIPVYDGRIFYSTSSELIEVDENGVLSVRGEIPEGGAVAFVTAAAGSSNETVTAVTRVVIGDYAGDKIVGSLTICARRIYEGELVAHGSLTFTTYEDIDLDVSYYEYYKPTDKYNNLMIDYEKHPENYSSDPALYSGDELGLSDRESYFDVIYRGENSDPETVSLLAGESISLSNYGFDTNNLVTIRKTLQGQIAVHPEVQALIDQIIKYENGEEIDSDTTFDAFWATFAQMYMGTQAMGGYNPADGHSLGGIAVNREMYNQFRRNDTQFPNNYYTVEITADELELLKAYLADPDNNYYSLFNMNCASGVIDMWNLTLSDRTELGVEGNLTGFGSDPQSLFFELGLMALNTDLDGYGGSDFYPRTVRYSDETKAVIEMIKGLADDGEDWFERAEEAIYAYDALSDAEKARVWNAEELEDIREIVENWKKAEALAEFNEYKQDSIAMLDSILSEDDSDTAKFIIAAAKGIIGIMPYDQSKTLKENKEDVDSARFAAIAALEKQRLRDHPILGDVDVDGEVTLDDATFIQRRAAWIPTPLTFNFDAGDTDGDGFVTVMDATYIQRWLEDMPSNDAIGTPIK